MFRYYDIKASSYCKLPKPLSNSKSIVNTQNDDIYCFLWCILAHKYAGLADSVQNAHKIDNYRERVSQYEKYFHELKQGDIQFPNLNTNVFQLPSNDKTLSPQYNNRNYYEEQIDLLFFENHFWLSTHSHNFCGKNEN